MNASKPENNRNTESLETLLDRVKKEVRELSAYNVPHIDCSVKLDGNESPYGMPKEIVEKVDALLSQIEINRYPDANCTQLKEKLSRLVNFPTDGIIFGNGSDELIGMLITTFCGRSGIVTIPTPTFSMYSLTSKALGMKTSEIPLDDKFDLDLAAMLEDIQTNDPDLIFLASPNNPSGNIFSAEKILEIIKASGGIVVVDEAYAEFAGQDFLSRVREHDNLIVLRTFSKVGYAGIRLGMLFANEILVHEINKVRYPYNINSLSQAVGAAVFENYSYLSDVIECIVEEKQRVFESLRAMDGITAYRSDANFIMFKVGDADKLWSDLVESDVLIRNFNKPGRLSNCMRVTIGTKEENDKFLEAIGRSLPS